MKHYQIKKTFQSRFLIKKRENSLSDSKQRGPKLLELSDQDFLKKIERSRVMLENCSICPNSCGVNRLNGKTGICGIKSLPMVAKAIPHTGEEPPLSGTKGAGTIFFSSCTMSCLFCQNYQISQEKLGEEISTNLLASHFLALKNLGCHNIELVSPTPHIPFILEALYTAKLRGLDLPIVYNTNGYITEEALKILDGIVDVYIPDMKYSDSKSARILSGTGNYVAENRRAVKEMVRQCGPLKVDNNSIAEKGVIIRILLLPEEFDGAEKTIEHIANEISTEISLSIMSQYIPLYRANEHPQLGVKIDRRRVGRLINKARSLGFSNIWIQKKGSENMLIPDFKKENPFL